MAAELMNDFPACLWLEWGSRNGYGSAQVNSEEHIFPECHLVNPETDAKRCAGSCTM